MEQWDVVIVPVALKWLGRREMIVQAEATDTNVNTGEIDEIRLLEVKMV